MRGEKNSREWNRREEENSKRVEEKKRGEVEEWEKREL